MYTSHQYRFIQCCYIQNERAAGGAPEPPITLEHIDAQAIEAGGSRLSATYRPASAALSLRSYGCPAGSRNPQPATRPATALAISPSRLEKKSSPNKAASASPAASSARKASAVITRRPGIPSLDLKDIQQENQGKSASKAAQMLSPSSPGAGARQALQESPTKYVERFLMSGIDASVFCCVPGMLVMQVSKQSSSCKHTPASKGATLAGVYQKCARAACKFDCTPDCTVAIIVLLLV